MRGICAVWWWCPNLYSTILAFSPAITYNKKIYINTYVIIQFSKFGHIIKNDYTTLYAVFWIEHLCSARDYSEIKYIASPPLNRFTKIFLNRINLRWTQLLLTLIQNLQCSNCSACQSPCRSAYCLFELVYKDSVT